MDPISTFILAMIVFLSLPLPLFAGQVLKQRPTIRPSIMRWVWIDKGIGSVAGLAIIATPVSPWIGLILAATAFLWCGMGICRAAAFASPT